MLGFEILSSICYYLCLPVDPRLERLWALFIELVRSKGVRIGDEDTASTQDVERKERSKCLRRTTDTYGPTKDLNPTCFFFVFQLLACVRVFHILLCARRDGHQFLLPCFDVLCYVYVGWMLLSVDILNRTRGKQRQHHNRTASAVSFSPHTHLAHIWSRTERNASCRPEVFLYHNSTYRLMWSGVEACDKNGGVEEARGCWLNELGSFRALIAWRKNFQFLILALCDVIVDDDYENAEA